MKRLLLAAVLLLSVAACDDVCDFVPDFIECQELCRFTPDWVGGFESWWEHRRWCQPGAPCSDYEAPELLWVDVYEYLAYRTLDEIVCPDKRAL